MKIKILFLGGCWMVLALFSSVAAEPRLEWRDDTGALVASVGETKVDLGRLVFTSRKAGPRGVVLLDRLVRAGEGRWRLEGAEEDGTVEVRVGRVQSDALEVEIDLRGIDRTGLFRPVVAFAAPDFDGLAESAPPRRSDGFTVARVDLGGVVLEAKYDATHVARAMVAMGDGNLIAWRQHSRVIDLPEWPIFRVRLSLQSKSPGEAETALRSRLVKRAAASEARLQAWAELFEGELADKATSLNAMANDLERKRDDAWSQNETLAEVYQRFDELDEATRLLEGVVRQLIRDNREIVRRTAGEKLAGMSYRAGLARDGFPTAEEHDDWALFGMGLLRLGANPVWHDGRSREARVERVQQVLDDAMTYGAEVLLSVHEEQAATGPADLTFTHEFIPALRSGFHEFGFNSARLREINLGVFADWLEATRDHPAVWGYKIDNEPFWSTQEHPVFGYDQATIGCAPAVFAAALRSVYPTVEAWRERLAGSLAAEVIEWQDWSDMALPEGAAAGLTFVDYLRSRYGRLDELNRAWGAEFTDWKQIFPPLPQVEVGREADDSGAPEFDIGVFNPGAQPDLRPAPGEELKWADWTRFWAHNINDELREYVALARRRGIAVPVTTNCLAGHMLTSSHVTHSLFPWVTSAGLDALAIDFYRTGYLQAYMRILAGAAGGRPIEIHETGGSDTAEDAWFMTAYAYAYGARGLLFWRRDHVMPPASALGVAQAVTAVSDPDLQQRSQPLTDGILMVYPFDGLYLSGAHPDRPPVMIEAMQGAMLWAKRRQWQFTAVADTELTTALVEHGPRMVVLPAGQYMSAQGWAALKSYLEKGGAALATPEIGRWDDAGRVRDEAERASVLDHPGLRVVPALAWETAAKERQPVVASRLGLTGGEPPQLSELDEWWSERVPTTVRYLDGVGKLMRTHAAVRESADAWYVFVDPWTDAVTVEIAGPVASARDLVTGESLSITPLAHGAQVSVTRSATVVKISKARAGERSFQEVAQ